VLAPVAALLVVLIGAMPLLFAGREGPPTLLIGLPVVIVAAHWASAASLVDAHRIEWPARVVGLIVWWVAPTAQRDEFGYRLLAGVGAYALIYAFGGTLAAFLAEAGRAGEAGD
jgi:hypothetical protein